MQAGVVRVYTNRGQKCSWDALAIEKSANICPSLIAQPSYLSLHLFIPYGLNYYTVASACSKYYDYIVVRLIG